MPHNWASAEFIRLAVHLLALDRGQEMHLFEGLPTQWTKPGMVTQAQQHRHAVRAVDLLAPRQRRRQIGDTSRSNRSAIHRARRSSSISAVGPTTTFKPCKHSIPERVTRSAFPSAIRRNESN